MIPVFVQTKEDLLAAGLRAVLADSGAPGLTFRFFSDFTSLTANVPADFSGVILVELDRGNGIGLVAALLSKAPAAKIVLWVRDLPVEQAHQAIELGARGILRKDLSIELTSRCLQKVAAGELWFERTLTDVLLHTRTVTLSRRQRQLLMLISQGMSNKEIASALYLSEGTVKVYLSKLFRKLGARDRFDLALYGVRNCQQQASAGLGGEETGLPPRVVLLTR